jgi:hypothetical protein
MALEGPIIPRSLTIHSLFFLSSKAIDLFLLEAVLKHLLLGGFHPGP